MHITKTEVELTSLDLMSIIEDYIKIPNLKLNEIQLDKLINIKGEYKAGVRLSFEIKLSIVSYKKDSIIMKLEKIKIGKVGVFSWIKKFALNKIMSNLNLRGITSEKDAVTFQIKKLLDTLPVFLDLELMGLEINQNRVCISVMNVRFSMKKVESSELKIASSELENINNSDVELLCIKHKTQDNYTKVRKNIEDRVPSKYEKLLEYAFILPDLAALFYRLFKDKRVSIKTKIVVGSVLGYLASPIDIVPDFMPFIGKIDDLALAFYALNKVVNEVPIEVIIENWQGDFNTLKKLKGGVTYLNKIAGGSNVDKLIQFAEKVYEFSKEDKIEDIESDKKEKI